MAFRFLNNIPLKQAVEEYSALMESRGFAPGTEMIPAVQSAGRVTACAVYAAMSAPHYAASAMDGIAILATDSFGAGETTPVTLNRAQFDVVDTGDCLPNGRDCVVMIEDVVFQPDGTVRLYAPAVPWQHVRQIGEDICAGEMVLGSYRTVTPAAVGALLAAGVQELSVLRRPRVGIIPTGDEIVPAASVPKEGEILEFNSAIFSAMLARWDGDGVVYPIVPDVREKIQAAVARAAEECDIVLLNAGSSAGREDFSADIIAELGGVYCHGLAMKPGKPAILGYMGEKPIIGVPGYPVSGILVLEQVVKPLLDMWYHRSACPREGLEARLTRPVVSGLKYEEFVRVRMGRVGESYIATPLDRGAGVVSSFMRADGILRIPQGSEGFEAGSHVQVELLRPVSELDRTLLSIGSHDPLQDELADMLHRRCADAFMSSSHVGSMGGIMAVRRGEAHMAGIHLLDEKDGSYNISFLRRYFPRGGVRLVECVGRTQGLMLAKGNPLGISDIGELTKPKVRYVNRQKGSGTRILMDYLCKKEGIDTEAIYGYDREEFTHTSVATQIAAGSADAGMGIWSAAKLYDLEFLPICTEQYDLLVPDEAWDSPMLQSLLDCLGSDEFRSRLEALGGYTLDRPGRVRERF